MNEQTVSYAKNANIATFMSHAGGAKLLWPYFLNSSHLF